MPAHLPPLELGLIKDAMGSYTLGFVLLSAFSMMCLVVNYLVFLRKPGTASVHVQQLIH